MSSDDWVSEEAYAQILKTLEELTRGPETVDLLIVILYMRNRA